MAQEGDARTAGNAREVTTMADIEREFAATCDYCGRGFIRPIRGGRPNAFCREHREQKYRQRVWEHRRRSQAERSSGMEPIHYQVTLAACYRAMAMVGMVNVGSALEANRKAETAALLRVSPQEYATKLPLLLEDREVLEACVGLWRLAAKALDAARD
jgi:hypothetical protein